ncbi:MAG TPA: amidohydrolase family protein [Xanthobacteraceae bacterium]|nr:amidohydrolase family protein [Xanthobacteraceae bacterium]
MSDRYNVSPTIAPEFDAPYRRHDASAAGPVSRRRFLKSSVGLAASGATVQILPRSATAQGADAMQPDAELARLQGQQRILLKGGVVLTLDRQVGDFVQADVLIEDGKIAAVGPNIAVSAEAAVVIDAANHILIPGFVDTHSHSYQGILRGIMTNGVLDPDYNRDVQAKLTPAFQPGEVYAGVLITALGLIDMGTTAIVDLSQISHTPEHSDACIRALQDSGIRALYAYSRGLGSATQYPHDVFRLQRAYFNTKDQLLTLALGVGLDAKAFGVARDAGVPAVLHMRNDSAGLLALGGAGLLRPGDEYIHCTNLSGDAWRVIRDTGGHVSLCPQIEMSMGHGIPAVQDALDHGLRPSLSSDHSVAIAPDFFTVMRTVFTFQRMQIFARARSGAHDLSPLLTCREVLEFATIEGARCANLDGKIGTLTPGKEADIVMLRADRLSLWPLNNAPGAVVNLMNPGNVDTVFIAGRVKKWHGRLVGADVPRLMRMAEEARDVVMRRAGFSVNFLA